MQENGFPIDKYVCEYRENIIRLYGREISIIVTEWNHHFLNYSISMESVGHCIVFADGLLSMTRAGREQAICWTLRWSGDDTKSNETRNYGLLDEDSFEPTGIGELFQWFCSELSGAVLVNTELSEDVRNINCQAYLARESKRLMLFLVNRGPSEKGIQIQFGDFDVDETVRVRSMMPTSVLQGRRVTVDDRNMITVVQKVNCESSSCCISVPPYSVTEISVEIM